MSTALAPPEEPLATAVATEAVVTHFDSDDAVDDILRESGRAAQDGKESEALRIALVALVVATHEAGHRRGRSRAPREAGR